MKRTTLCYLLREGSNGTEVCLATKKHKSGPGRRNYVSNYLNAAGGHVEDDETIGQAACREIHDEQMVEVQPEDLFFAAIVEFRFPEAEHTDNTCFIFTATKWQGEPQESDELGPPEWHKIDDLPVRRLPPGDRIWLGRVLQGERLHAVLNLDSSFRPKTASLTPLSTTPG